MWIFPEILQKYHKRYQNFINTGDVWVVMATALYWRPREKTDILSFILFLSHKAM